MSEYQRQKIVSTAGMLDITIPVILVNKATKLVIVQEPYQLCEYVFVFVHLQSHWKAAK